MAKHLFSAANRECQSMKPRASAFQRMRKRHGLRFERVRVENAPISPPHKAPRLPSGLLERSAGRADAQPDDGGWRQRREQLRVGGGVRDEEEEEEEEAVAGGVCGKGTRPRSGKRLDAGGCSGRRNEAPPPGLTVKRAV